MLKTFKDLTEDEIYVINVMREASKFSTFRIEKNNGKLVFIISEKKEKIVINREGVVKNN